MLRVKPIYGSTGHHGSSKSISLPPSCTLIEYGGVRVLVNVGFDESLTFPDDGKDHSDSTVDRAGANAGVANSVPSSLPDVDAVLLTDSSLQSIGGLPRYFGSSFGNNSSNTRQPPIYATFPTVKMGQMNLYDNHANISLDGGNPGYSLSDVDDLFSPLVLQSGDSDGQISGNINPGDNSEPSKLGSSSSSSSSRTIQPIQTIKYAQTIIIKDPNTQKPAIAITPQRAGHLIGASYFTLKRLTDETEVVVAPIYHHAKEKHLDNSTLYEYASACDVLVTTCGGPGSTLGSLYIPPDRMYKSKPILKPPKVATDERELIESILSTLRRGGNVLLPTDASGRVLELLYLLNEHWERHRLGSAYNLCWVGSMVHNTVEFARSQLEWMAGPLGAQFDTGRGHPFSLKGVKMFSTVAELEANCLSSGDVNGLGGVDSDSNPCCVLASGATLDCGPARDLFLKWSENADNAIILTDSRRCVQRGSVIQSRVSKAGSDALPTGSARSPSKDSSASIAGVSNNSSIPTLASGGETPNIVQEDEEAGAISIGSALTIDRTSEYSTAGQLLLKWCEAKAAREEMADLIDCDTMVPKRAPLAGAELKTFLQQEEAKRLKEKAAEERRAMLREVELAKGRLRLIEEEAAPTGGSSKAGAVAGTSASSTKAKDIKGQDVSSRPKKKSRFDANLFLKYSKPCHSKYIFAITNHFTILNVWKKLIKFIIISDV
jgi:cleavage and polyadenylation specificity factor subunit 2